MKQIEKAAEKYALECQKEEGYPSPMYDSCDAKDMRECAFKSGAEWHAKQSPWISVKDRLPQTDDDLYIVLDDRMNPPGCGVCDFNPKTETWIDYDYNIIYPTHWMPIPTFDEILEANKDVLKRIKEKGD